LEHGLDASAFHSRSQGQLPWRCAPAPDIHFGLEETHRRPPFCFGPVQGDIGFAERRFSLDRISRHEGDPDSNIHAMCRAARPMGVLSASMIRSATFVAASGPARCDAGSQLIATETRDHISIPHGRTQALAYDDQYFIADTVPIDVIDLLESVEIQQQHTVGGAGPGWRCQCGLEGFVVLPSIRQSGQAILVRKFLSMPLGRNSPRDLPLLSEV